jgi:carbamate kinase
MPRETVVIALGGNSILSAREKFSIHQEIEHVEESCRRIAAIVRAGYRVVLTHGNGPQVGDILLQQELARGRVPPMPLDVCGAQTQGELGYLLQRTLGGMLPGKRITTIVTQVVVDPGDSAFRNPTKFIGPFLKTRPHSSPGRVYGRDSDRGFRRVVPSPEPLEIVERGEIRSLVRQGFIVIACGGGGIPVFRRASRLEGAGAVIDKDRAAVRLARAVGASTLLMITGVDRVYLSYGTPHRKPLVCMTPKEAGRYLMEGQFPPGSMGPKIEAAIRFIKHGGKRVIITSREKSLMALRGRAGTTIKARPCST